MYKHFFKRVIDIVFALLVLIVFSPVLLVVWVWLHFANKGAGAFFYQDRPGKDGKIFKVVKFKTMTDERDAEGNLLPDTERLTKVGKMVRASSLDELPQLINIFKGEMSFVGTRPEVLEYVRKYKPEWRATLLLPAGVTSLASVKYRHEDEELEKLMQSGMSLDEAYLQCILPEKMKYNLDEMKGFTVFHDMGILIRTVFAVLH